MASFIPVLVSDVSVVVVARGYARSVSTTAFQISLVDRCVSTVRYSIVSVLIGFRTVFNHGTPGCGALGDG
jgi:hypothetical protein